MKNKELEQEVKKMKEVFPYLTFVVVGITKRQQPKFIKYMQHVVNLGAKKNDEDETKVLFIPTQINGQDVLYVVAPGYDKYVNMYRNALKTINNYTNGTSFCAQSLSEVYCVDVSGELVAPGRFALVCVKSVDKLDEETKDWLLNEIPVALNVVKSTHEGDKIIYSCQPSIDRSRRSVTIRKAILTDCSVKTKQLSIALTNCPEVCKLDCVGNEMGDIFRKKSHIGRENSELLSIAQDQLKQKKTNVTKETSMTI